MEYFVIYRVTTQSEDLPSNVVSVIPRSAYGPFVAPTNFTKQEPDDGTLRLSWNGFGEVDSYRIFYSTEPGLTSTSTYRSITSTSSSNSTSGSYASTSSDSSGWVPTEYTFSDLDSETRYFFRIAAVNSAGVGELSEELSGTPFEWVNQWTYSSRRVQSLGIDGDGRIYKHYGSTLYAYDSVDAMTAGSSALWTLNVSGASGNPVISKADGTIYVGGNPLRAVGRNGQLKWSYQQQDCSAGLSNLSLGDDGVVYGHACNNFYAINPDGTQKWKKLAINNNMNTSVISDEGKVFVRDSNGSTLYALSQVDGSVIWSKYFNDFRVNICRFSFVCE